MQAIPWGVCPLEFTGTQRLIIGVSLGLALVSVLVVLLLRGCGGGSAVSVDGDLPGDPEVAAGDVITVHVVGAVRYPGVYRVRAGSRMNDVVAAAGGLAPGADEYGVNLAAPVEDGQQVYVPGRLSGAGAAPQVASVPPARMDYTPVPPSSGRSVSRPQSTGPAGSASEPYGGAPASQGDAPPPGSPQYAPPPTSGSQASLPQAIAAGSGANAAGRGQVNLNTATEQQLEALPGIGPSLARRIIAYREQNGPFRRVEDLERVKGIGPSTLVRLRPEVAL